jgi:formylglycine-generating enzyme required for sulfatase activity
MRRIDIATFVLVIALPGVAPAVRAKCPKDSVQVGTTCVDKYEASVWQISISNMKLIDRVKAGQATLADLQAGGATQLGCNFAPFDHGDYPASFPVNGQWTPVVGSSPPTPGVYAASIPGVLPSACVTWFQAAQACALSGKRLPSNREWQDAVAGTPDPGTADDGSSTCATSSAKPANTGSRSGCVSNWGAFDMVGNVWEWVSDWDDLAPTALCQTTWPSQAYGGDISCFGGNAVGRSGALIRGGAWDSGALAGPFAVYGGVTPSYWDSSDYFIGFRCAR